MQRNSVRVAKTDPDRGFFGRRKSKALSARKRRLMEEFLPDLLVDLSQPCPANASELFSDRPQTLILEIGFGAGEHLLDQAASAPDAGFIGIEPFINSMAKALSEIERLKLRNIRLFDDDATFLLDWLPAGSLDRIDLLYPDPWPKKRHWKRRFVNQANLKRFHRVLKANGTVCFASDIDSYVNWTLNAFDLHPGFKWRAADSADWKNPWQGWKSTRYENKAIREGRTPTYLSFCRI